MNLTQIAIAYAQATGCDAATAMQASFAAAYILAAMTGQEKAAEYMSQRYNDMEQRKTGETMVQPDFEYVDPAGWTGIPANEIELRRYRSRWD